jgi:hypoxanthine phosphoribosyltransferase
MKFVKNFEILIDENRLQKRIEEMGAKITEDFFNKDLVLICILKGSFIFLSDLCRNIHLPMTVDFLGVSSYGARTETSGVVKITQDLAQPIVDKDVLIVEDIVDTGLTLNYILENFRTRLPRSVSICTLLYKPSNIVRKVHLDYVGFEIENKFVVGYGLDIAEKYRNLPYIGAFTEIPADLENLL